MNSDAVHLVRDEGNQATAPDFLASIAETRSIIDGRHIAVVGAHPDDETIGCAALLCRLSGVSIIVVTDGAPRKQSGAEAHGFASAQEYAAARARELRQALGLADIGEGQIVRLGTPDQHAALSLARISRQLASIMVKRGISVALTHVYEGGHPDHDATAFAVHAAGKLMRRRGWPLHIVEIPLYHLGDGSMIVQQFPGGPDGVTVRLSEEARSLKARMIAAHHTQAQMLSQFPCDYERFRWAMAHDFRNLPNRGRLLYEAYDWGMTGTRWLELTARAMAELGLEEADSCP